MQRVFGVDFSGARNAGSCIWIAEAAVLDGYVSVRRCLPARELEGSGVARETALAALRALVVDAPDAVFGLDFPFGLPAALTRAPDWETFVSGFAARYADADAFRRAAFEAAGRRELRRRTDIDAATPFAAYNLRLYKQTYYGIRDVLAPLHADDHARALPMQTPVGGRARLLEVCPASTLSAHGVAGPYKGRGDALEAARAGLVNWLVRTTPMAIPADLRDRAAEDAGGDAVDALVAVAAVARALETPAQTEQEYLLEGYVYV